MSKPAAKTQKTKPAVKPAAKPAPKKAAKPVVKPAAKPAAKPAKKPASKPAAKAPAKVAAKPTAKPNAKPAAKPAPKATAKPVSKPVVKPVNKPVNKPVSKPASKPVSKPVTKPGTKPAAKPAASATKPVAKAPAAKPMAKPAAKPVAAPAAPPKPAAPVVMNKPVAKPELKPAAKAPVTKPSRSAATNALLAAQRAPLVSTPAGIRFMDRFAPARPVKTADPIEVQKSIYKADPKLVNAWKTKTGRELSEAELLAMPDGEYMNEKQVEFFRQRLKQQKDDLLSNAEDTTEHLREDTTIVPDPADRATIEEEHALELRTRDRERKLLKKITQSMSRLDSGEYGFCDETGEPIGLARLLARPTATLSLEAQQRREMKQKMFGD